LQVPDDFFYRAVGSRKLIKDRFCRGIMALENQVELLVNGKSIVIPPDKHQVAMISLDYPVNSIEAKLNVEPGNGPIPRLVLRISTGEMNQLVQGEYVVSHQVDLQEGDSFSVGYSSTPTGKKQHHSHLGLVLVTVIEKRELPEQPIAEKGVSSLEEYHALLRNKLPGEERNLDDQLMKATSAYLANQHAYYQRTRRLQDPLLHQVLERLNRSYYPQHLANKDLGMHGKYRDLIVWCMEPHRKEK